MCALVTGVQTCALPISSKRPGYDLASVARKARSYILSRSKRALLVRLEQRADLVDVRLHRRIRLAALELGPGVMLGPADHVEHAWPRAADITFTGLIEVGVESQIILVVRSPAQGSDVVLFLWVFHFSVSPGVPSSF